jgi:hypothetical protein
MGEHDFTKDGRHRWVRVVVGSPRGSWQSLVEADQV